jgi:hypothetical protein
MDEQGEGPAIRVTEDDVRGKFGFKENKIKMLDAPSWFIIYDEQGMGLLMHFSQMSAICKARYDEAQNKLLISRALFQQKVELNDPLVESKWFLPEGLKKLHSNADFINDDELVVEKIITVKMRKAGEDWQEWQISENDAKKLLGQ